MIVRCDSPIRQVSVTFERIPFAKVARVGTENVSSHTTSVVYVSLV
jgi:hypothetical protein